MFTNITRTTLCITAFSIASLMAAPLDATKTESLDWNWKFARFGKMPDGSTQPEPGKAMGFATATSEESGNPADNAVDGDKSTRWCADGGKSGEKITVDMGRPVDVKTVNILWEKQNNHLFKLEGSGDGKRWTTIEDKNFRTKRLQGRHGGKQNRQASLLPRHRHGQQPEQLGQHP